MGAPDAATAAVTATRERTAPAIETLSKRAALVSALLAVVLQIACQPDATPVIRAAATVAVFAGWLAARPDRGGAQTFWLAVGILSPALLRLATGREGPVLDLIWMAGLTGALVRAVSWRTWTFPPAWRVLAGGWALVITCGWPVLVAREINFRPVGLLDLGAINSSAGLSAPRVVAWILWVVLVQLIGLLWLDWLMGRLARTRPDTTSDDKGPLPLVIHGLWCAATAASLVAIVQGTVAIGFLSSPNWASLRRATGTMLDANGYGVLAAIGGPVAYVALRSSRLHRRVPLAVAALAANLAGMWMSGSRLALLCASAGMLGLAAGEWVQHPRARARLLAGLATGLVAIGIVLGTTGVAVGPIARLRELPAAGSHLATALVDRGGYGLIARRMLREYPLTGVGIGSYHVIAPDYGRMLMDQQLPFDNAQNWWRHQAAELGLLGGLPVLLWSLVIAWQVLTRRVARRDRATARPLRGLLIGVGAASLLGVPTQSPPVLLAFLLVVAWLATLQVRQSVSPDDGVSPGAAVLPHRHHADARWDVRAPDPWWTGAAWTVVLVLALAYAGGHLLLARGSLSPATRALRSGRNYASRAYPPEVWPEMGPFQWTRGDTEFFWRAATRWLVIRVRAQHPDIAGHPVQVRITSRCGTLMDVALHDTDTFSVGVELPQEQSAVDARVRVSRTWRPAAFGSIDPRTLGVALTSGFVGSRSEAEQVDAPVVELPHCPGML